MTGWSHQSDSSEDRSAFVSVQQAAQDAISGWDRVTLGDLKRAAAGAAEGIRENAKAYKSRPPIPSTASVTPPPPPTT